MSEHLLELRGIVKDFGEGPVLRGIDLAVEAGEFLTLLGPSGCGKTTTLRLIAGLEDPTSGDVLVDGVSVLRLPPEKRPVNTVFQNYALFPHMNVEKNIAYGLRVRGVKSPERRRLTEEMLELVRLPGYGKRMPSELSGGQRQRVAIARALVLKPRLLLLDEPLGALDLKLRREMQEELKRIQRETGISFIYITHDQEEALNMSTRIAVMNGGCFEQIGTPKEIYEHPASLFCARFIGQSNLVPGVLDEDGSLLSHGLRLPAASAQGLACGEPCVLSLRPQRIRYDTEPCEGFFLRGTVESLEYSGGMQHMRVTVSEGLTLTAVSDESIRKGVAPGMEVYLSWNPDYAPLVRNTEANA